MALANRWVTTRQLGFLLGFMGTRVLGQYDLALLSAEATPGRLLFVEENIRADRARPGRAARAVPDLDRPPRDDPRLRVRGASLAAAVPRRAARAPADAVRHATPRGLGREALRGLGRALRGEAGGEHWIERLMGPEQRRLFRETQAVMSLLEGFSDYVMDEVGRDLVPDVERISARFHERRDQADAVRAGDAPADRHGPEDGAVPEGRAVRAGDRRRARGRGALTRLWDGPETLPRDGEIEAPERWIARVLDGRPARRPTPRRDAASRPTAGPGLAARAAPRRRSP